MKTALALAAVIAVIALSPVSRAATVTGQNGHVVSVFPNPFAGATITSGTPDINNRNPGPTVDRTAAYGRLRKDSAPNVSTGYMQFVAPAAFTTGTVISYRQGAGAGPMGNAHITLGGTEVQNLADNDLRIYATTLASPVTSDTMRVDYPNGLGVYSPSVFISDVYEVLVLEPSMTQLAPTAPNASPVFYGSKDLTVDNLMANGWMPMGTDSSPAYNGNRYIELDTTLPGPTGKERLAGVVIAFDTNPMFPADTMLIQQWTGAAWQTVATVTGTAASEILPIRFDTLLLTEGLRFDLGVGQQWRGIQDFTLLQVTVPEPVSAALLGLGLVLLPRRRRG